MKTFFKNQSNVFWLLQLLGWGFLTSLMISLEEYSLKFKIISTLTVLFEGIVSTSLLRYYLKARVINKSYNIKVLFHLLASLLGTILVFMALGQLDEYLIENVFLIENEAISDASEQSKKWIYTSIGLFFMMSIWLLLYVTIKFVIKSNKERIERLELINALRDAQLNTLKGQINPHFMFNSLNNIRGLMLEDVHRSREMITKLSDMLRYSLVKNGNDAILLEEELEMVDNYVALSKIQMEDRLQYITEIDESLESISIPPMLIQLLVENAAKHGIANQKNGGIIKLTIKKEDNDLVIEVKNTGTLNIAENSTKLGLENIKERLHLLYGSKATFSLTELDNEVLAKIKIEEL